ncbi:MAG: hypothetical protein CMC15_15165 [Flavobacteriaceae bacterium]|nr:hypothetical protein [Flavobacteriaceae bacterium]
MKIPEWIVDLPEDQVIVHPVSGEFGRTYALLMRKYKAELTEIYKEYGYIPEKFHVKDEVCFFEQFVYGRVLEAVQLAIELEMPSSMVENLFDEQEYH